MRSHSHVGDSARAAHRARTSRQHVAHFACQDRHLLYRAVPNSVRGQDRHLLFRQDRHAHQRRSHRRRRRRNRVGGFVQVIRFLQSSII